MKGSEERKRKRKRDFGSEGRNEYAHRDKRSKGKYRYYTQSSSISRRPHKQTASNHPTHTHDTDDINESPKIESKATTREQHPIVSTNTDTSTCTNTMKHSANIAYVAGTNVLVKVEDDYGGITFEPALIMSTANRNCNVQWYINHEARYKHIDLYNKHINELSSKYNVSSQNILVLDVSTTQTIHMDMISTIILVISDVGQLNTKHLMSAVEYICLSIEEIVDESKPLMRRLRYMNESNTESEASNNDSDYIVNYAFENKYVFETMHDRLRTRKLMNEIKENNKRGIVETIAISSDDEDDETCAITGAQTISTCADAPPKPRKKKRKQRKRNTKRKQRKRKKKRRKPKSKAFCATLGYKTKKSSVDYTKYLNIAVEENTRYQKSKANLSSVLYPYPHRDTDHANTPKKVVMLAFWIMETTFDIDFCNSTLLLDVTPFRCAYDFCNYKLWNGYSLLFINPPWSCPWWYIIEAHKFLRSGDKRLVVLLIMRGSNKRYWQQLVSHAVLIVDVSGIKFGGYEKKAPMMVSLVFLYDDGQWLDESSGRALKLSLSGNVDVEDWESEIDDNTRIHLQKLYDERFLELDIDLIK